MTHIYSYIILIKLALFLHWKLLPEVLPANKSEENIKLTLTAHETKFQKHNQIIRTFSFIFFSFVSFSRNIIFQFIGLEASH